VELHLNPDSLKASTMSGQAPLEGKFASRELTRQNLKITPQHVKGCVGVVVDHRTWGGDQEVGGPA